MFELGNAIKCSLVTAEKLALDEGAECAITDDHKGSSGSQQKHAVCVILC